MIHQELADPPVRPSRLLHFRMQKKAWRFDGIARKHDDARADLLFLLSQPILVRDTGDLPGCIEREFRHHRVRVQFSTRLDGFLDVKERLVLRFDRTERNTGAMPVACRPAVERSGVFRLHDLRHPERDRMGRPVGQRKLELVAFQLFAEVLVEIGRRDALTEFRWIASLAVRLGNSKIGIDHAVRRCVSSHPHLVLGFAVVGSEIGIADRPITNGRILLVLEEGLLHLEIVRHHAWHESLPMPQRPSDEPLVPAFEPVIIHVWIFLVVIRLIAGLVAPLRCDRRRRRDIIRRPRFAGVRRVLAFAGGCREIPDERSAAGELFGHAARLEHEDADLRLCQAVREQSTRNTRSDHDDVVAQIDFAAGRHGHAPFVPGLVQKVVDVCAVMGGLTPMTDHTFPRK